MLGAFSGYWLINEFCKGWLACTAEREFSAMVLKKISRKGQKCGSVNRDPYSPAQARHFGLVVWCSRTTGDKQLCLCGWLSRCTKHEMVPCSAWILETLWWWSKTPVPCFLDSGNSLRLQVGSDEQERCLWAVEGLMFGGLQRGGLAQGGRVELMIEQHGPCLVELRRQLHGRMLGNEKDFPGREFLPSVSKIARKNSYHSTRKRQITHFESR